MKNNIFKKLLSISTAALTAITGTAIIAPWQTAEAAEARMQQTAVYAESDASEPAETVTATTPITTTTTNIGLISLSFEPPTGAQIAVGETLTVTMYKFSTGEEWSGDFPEITIADPSIVSVTEGETSSTFEITGLAVGSTYIHCNTPGQGSSGYSVSVIENDEDSTTTTTTAPENPLSTETTTTTVEEGILCNISELEMEAGQRKSVGLFFKNGTHYSGTLAKFSVDHPAVAVVQTSDVPYEFFVIGITEGSAVITITDPIYGYTTTLNVTVTGTLPEDPGSDSLRIIIDSMPDKLTYHVGESLDLTGGTFSVEYDMSGQTYKMLDGMDMTTAGKSRVITGAFDSQTPGTYPIIIAYNHTIYGTWDICIFYVTVTDSAEAEKGDINQDGAIGIDDATMVLEYYARTAAGIDAEIIVSSADIDGDNQITISDATYILTCYARKAAGLSCDWNEIIGG
ncbi:MAG: bacterial Ig-like domain-containing protein [Ruminococcus sp.]